VLYIRSPTASSISAADHQRLPLFPPAATPHVAGLHLLSSADHRKISVIGSVDMDYCLSLATMIMVEKGNWGGTGFPERPRREEIRNESGEKNIRSKCRWIKTLENRPTTRKSKQRQSQCASYGHTRGRSTIDALALVVKHN
jgi:hypothetical protein